MYILLFTKIRSQNTIYKLNLNQIGGFMRKAKIRLELGTEQARRVIYMYNKFLEGNSYSSAEMYDEVTRVFKVDLSLRTVQRDLRTLHEMVPNMEQVNVGRQVYWRLSKNALAPRYLSEVDASDMLSFHYLKGYLSEYSNSILGKEVDKLIKKIDHVVPGKAFLYDAKIPNYEFGVVNYKNYSSIFEEIIMSITEKKWLNISYIDRFDDEIHHHFAQFKGFFTYNGSLCFVAFVSRRHEFAIIPMESIIKTIPGQPYNEYVPDFDIHALFEDKFGITPGEKTEITVEFAKEVAEIWGNRTYSPNQKTTKFPDGVVQITFPITINKELIQWLMNFGGYIKVISPTEVIDLLKAELKKALEQY